MKSHVFFVYAKKFNKIVNGKIITLVVKKKDDYSINDELIFYKTTRKNPKESKIIKKIKKIKPIIYNDIKGNSLILLFF